MRVVEVTLAEAEPGFIGGRDALAVAAANWGLGAT